MRLRFFTITTVVLGVLFPKLSCTQNEAIGADSLLFLLNKTEEDTAKAGLYYRLGRSEMLQFNYKSAMVYFNASMKIYKQRGAHYNAALSMNEFADANYLIGNQETAFKHYYEAIKIAQAIRDTPMIINFTHEIGGILRSTNMAVAKEKFNEALSYCVGKHIGDKANCYIGLAQAYADEGNISKAFQLADSAHTIAQNHNIDALAYALGARGYVKSRAGDQKGSLIDLLEAEKVFQEQKREVSKYYLILKGNIAACYWRLGLVDKAIKNMEELIPKAKEMNDPTSLSQLHMGIARMYNTQGDYQKAYENLFIHKLMSDTLTAERLTMQLANKEAEFKTAKKEAQISALEKEAQLTQQLHASDLKKSRILTLSIAGGAMLSIVLLLTWIFSVRRRASMQQELTAKKQELDSKKATVIGQEIERERIAKELHDGLGGLLSSTKLKLSLLKDEHQIKVTEFSEAIEEVGYALKEVRAITHGMMPPDLKERPFVDLIRSYALKMFSPRNVSYELDFFPEEEINKLSFELKTNVYRIIQELCNNIIKHSNATNVELGLMVNENDFIILVQDDGKGFNKKEKADGVGLKSMESRAKLLNGSFSIQSEMMKGTTIEITFPVNYE